MRGRLLGKLKQNKAFTLMETLIVVAVIVVLLGIGVVNIVGWTEELRMKELDSYAKTIYMEAQNQLSSMEVEGGLPALSKKLSTTGSGYEGRVLSEEPSDYAYNGNASNRWNELYYLVDSDTIILEFVPKFSFVNSGNGKYLIEIAPGTGEIYGVFYWTSDNENEDLNGSAEEIYEFLKGMTKSDEDENNRGLKSRMQYEVGYYGGTLSETTVVTDYSLNQKVQIVNGEELYVVVSFDNKGKMLDYRNSQQFDITFEIKDESGNTWSYDMNAKELECIVTDTNGVPVENGSRIEFALLLDSTIEGYDFTTITGGRLVPGEDLSIKVGTTFRHGDLYLIENPITGGENSLFDVVLDAENVVEVGNVRHLKNLSKYNDVNDITIKQSGNIDFNNIKYAFEFAGGKAVYVGADKSTTSAPAFSPISNISLFNASSGRHVEFDGNSFEIRNLVIEAPGSADVGLFMDATNVTFSNVKIVDPTIKAEGSTNVGVLAGRLKDCTINNCGVYLNTYYRNAEGVKQYYNQAAGGNVMADRYAQYSVTGGTNVGGLVGLTVGSTITNSFAAVKVNGVENVGGFIGKATSDATVDFANPPDEAWIKNCYSSGDVRHLEGSSNYIGGFIGWAENLYVTDAYSTSNVYGNNYIGGFLGKSVGSLYGRCNSYGEVLRRNGSDSFGSAKVGGFISDAGNSGSDVVRNADGTSTCHFLKQIGYNEKLDEFGGAFSATYVNLAVNLPEEGAILARTTFPYDNMLSYKAFPFVSVTDSHYGNFPLQYTINNSLVYYEKYGENDYGYYCVTTLNGDTAEDYVWVLDTLRDQICIEDGYALLSMYYLDEIKYTNYQYKGSSWSETGSQTLDITTGNDYGANKMVLLGQQGGLQFNAYVPVSDVYGDFYTADYSKQSPKSSFTINGMYMYQLPYELQNANRTEVDNFYDVIVFDEGKAMGNDETTVVDDKIFYYCPHFAKLAVNPGTGVTSGDGTVAESVIANKSFDKLGQPITVYVRSARQLNALGRVPYYWNDVKGLSTKVTYVQEVDVNFSAYTKNYCGTTFNLMDTSVNNPVRNVPIGVPKLSGTYQQFRNAYDGKCNKIIDYCIESSEAFVGLFGEIRDASLKNIVMVSSGNVKPYVRAIGNTKPYSKIQRSAVGALVGLSYMYDNTIENCVAVGYDVEYDMQINLHNIAVGGLIGSSMSPISNCAAINDVTFKLETSDKDVSVFIAGLVGSHMYKPLSNSYSGGTVNIDNNGKGAVGYVSAGGVCAGALFIANETYKFGDAYNKINKGARSVSWSNLYTYTKISLGDNAMEQSCINTTTSKLIRDYSWADKNNEVQGGTENCYYLDNILGSLAVGSYNIGTSQTWEQLVAFTASVEGNNAFDLGSADYTYDKNGNRIDNEYPFPAVIKDESGKYVHYGDWPSN